MADKETKPAVVEVPQPDDAADLPPATEVDTSGAMQQIVPDIDLDHPAVDANPRARTSKVQNQIDFNDETLEASEAVELNLRNPEKNQAEA